MKKLTNLLMIFLIVSCNYNKQITIPEQKQEQIKKFENENIEDFGERIFKLLQTKDLESILKDSPKYKDYVDVYENSDWPTKKKVLKIKYFTENFDKSISDLKKSYKYTIDFFDKKNIDLTKCNLNYIDFEYDKFNKVERAQIYLKFTYDYIDYKILLKSCYKINGKWKIGNGIAIKNYRNSLIEG